MALPRHGLCPDASWAINPELTSEKKKVMFPQALVNYGCVCTCMGACLVSWNVAVKQTVSKALMRL